MNSYPEHYSNLYKLNIMNNDDITFLIAKQIKNIVII